MHNGLREWLEEVEDFEEIREIKGADWDLEIGALSQLTRGGTFSRSRLLLFDDIKGYPSGYRVLTGVLNSEKSLALTLGLPTQDYKPMALVRAIKDRFGKSEPIPPKVVSSGPVLENVYRGSDIDILRFPSPKWHELDGGRYFGTGDIIITKDPDEGWVNLGTYRIMIHDEKTLGFYTSPGRHGRMHLEKCFARGEPLRVVVCTGADPLLYLLSTAVAPYGISEYNLAGGIRGKPVEVIKGEYTGLPIPAHAEIAVEGECYLGEVKREGPFGEWTGYYASGIRPEPVIKIKKIMHRNNPIITGPSGRHQIYMKSAFIWEEMEKAGIPDIRGVWLMEEGRAHLLLVISIMQRYPGHARQALLVAAGCHAGAYTGRYIIVVDENIDPSDTGHVLWAIATRSDPQRSIDIIRRCWSTPLDPIIPNEEKGLNSRALIDACKPYEWKDDFPKVVRISDALKEKVLGKWGNFLE